MQEFLFFCFFFFFLITAEPSIIQFSGAILLQSLFRTAINQMVIFNKCAVVNNCIHAQVDNLAWMDSEKSHRQKHKYFFPLQFPYFQAGFADGAGKV